MNKSLLNILVCPLCHSELKYCHHSEEELLCRSCALSFPIRDDIPIMLESEARTLTVNERLAKLS